MYLSTSQITAQCNIVKQCLLGDNGIKNYKQNLRRRKDANENSDKHEVDKICRENEENGE